MALQYSETPARCCWRVEPNHTLQAHLARRLLWAVALVTGGIALAFAWCGAWLVLPFAGLEVLALWWCLRYVARHAADLEEIVLDGEHLAISTFSAGEWVSEMFQAYWVQVRWRPPSVAKPAGRLWVGSHGRSVEIGALLTGEQKRGLAKALQEQLQAWRTGATTASRDPEVSLIEKPNQP